MKNTKQYTIDGGVRPVKQMKYKTILRLLLFMGIAISINSLSAQTVSGTVTDAETGETLIGATVLETVGDRGVRGTVTNAQGRYTMTLKGASKVTLRFSYVGYSTQIHEVDISRNLQFDVKLEPSVMLQAVDVTAERVNSPRAAQMSAIEVPVEQLKMVPVLFGEADVLKALQLLPGVQGGTEGTSGIYVRGGGPDQNLFLLDGVPLYNVNHLGGFFSAFNSDAIKNVTLYKGSFPARFSGRISSVVDVATNNGNDKEWHGGLSVGTLAAKVSVEGPIVKEKTTFSFSARRTYGDLLLMTLLQSQSLLSDATVSFGYHFYDLNAKLVHRFNSRSTLFASVYMGDDVLKLGYGYVDGSYYTATSRSELKMGYNWGNLTTALRWNYVINQQLFMNITGTFTRYRNDLNIGLTSDNYWPGGQYVMDVDMSYNSGISDVALRADFDYNPAPEHSIRFGGSLTHHRFAPEVIGAKYNYTSSDASENEHIDTALGNSVVFAQEMMLYGEDDWSITEALKLNAGLALSGFLVEGKPYFNPQPRLSARYMLDEDLSIKVGYAHMAQYMHLLSSSNISLPTDLWVPVTDDIAPMTSHQVAAGLFYSWRSIIDFSVEGYYKSMNNLMEYRDGSSFFGSSASWEEKVCLGRGWSYGIEFLAQKSIGKFSGWLGYTWSHTWRLFDRPGQELNEGRAFPAKYDRTHDISLMLMYKPNDNFDISMTWVYSTGNTATLALQEIPSDYYDPSYYSPDYYDPYGGLFNDGSYFSFVESRNNYRLPAYHRMDVSVNFHKKLKHGIRTWALSVYNVYNRQNPFTIYRSYRYHTTIGDQTYSASLMQLSIFPIIPSVSYIYKF